MSNDNALTLWLPPGPASSPPSHLSFAPISICSFEDEPLPIDGYVTLSNKPGFGVTLNKKVQLVRPFPRVPKTFAEIEAAKVARTPDQAAWLNKAKDSIPIGQAAPTTGGNSTSV